MKDIAKCAGNGCDLRDGCDRFVRPAVDRQEWVEPTLEPAWWEPAWNSSGTVMVCVDYRPVQMIQTVQPHGVASEEVDAC